MDKKDRLAEKIEQAVKPYCCADWCILKEIVKSRFTEPSFFVQLKCIEFFKTDESRRQGHDIGMNHSMSLWVERGYAKIFRDVYDEELPPDEVYQLILKAPIN